MKKVFVLNPTPDRTELNDTVFDLTKWLSNVTPDNMYTVVHNEDQNTIVVTDNVRNKLKGVKLNNNTFFIVGPDNTLYIYTENELIKHVINSVKSNTKPQKKGQPAPVGNKPSEGIVDMFDELY